jgi:hypothetical protein
MANGASPGTSIRSPAALAVDGVLSSFEPNVRVTSDQQGLGPLPFQTEPIIAANPLDPRHLVVGAIDFNSEFGEVVAYRSLDGGGTWAGPSYVPQSPRLASAFASDPVLAVTRDGRFYYSYVSIGLTSTNDDVSDLVVSASSDGGISWQAVVARTGVRDFLNDKPWLTIGPSRTNPEQESLYLTYTEFDFRLRPQVSMQVKSMRSENGGVSWLDPVPVSPRGTFPQVVQGSMPSVGPDGIVYVAYYDAAGAFLRGLARIMVSRSLDGGQSFEPPREAASLPQELSFASNWFRWWGSMHPRIVIDSAGTIYITYSADPDGDGPDGADVFLVRSVDRGLSWTTPVQVADDTTHRAQFFPALAVGPDGRVHLIWGDRRLDPTETGYDIFYAVSSDGGTTFGPNERVTDVTSTSRQGLNAFIGDYFHLVVTPLNVHLVWTDTRRGSLTPTFIFDLNEDIFATRVGDRAAPVLSALPANSQAGASSLTTLAGAHLPREASLDVLYGDTKLASVQTDVEGTFSGTITLPPLPPGLHNLKVAELTTGRVLASTPVTVGGNPEIANVQAELERARRELAERLANQSVAFGALRDGVSQDLARSETLTAEALAASTASLTAAIGQTDIRLVALATEVSTLQGILRVLTTALFVAVGAAVFGAVGMLAGRRRSSVPSPGS